MNHKKQNSKIGLGLAALGRPGYINLGHAQDFHGNYDPFAMEKNAHDVLDTAWSGGIRYFEAARSYGLAEKFLSSWLHSRKINYDEVTVASKWGYTYTADWQINVKTHEVKDHSIERLRTQWKESDSILGDYLNIYYIHSATKESGVLENNNVLQELFDISKLGISIGLTVSGKSQSETIAQALQITINNVPLFQCVQATWNLLEQSSTSILQKAHDQGVNVVIKETLANGRLSDRNSDPRFKEKRKILEEVALHSGTSVDSVAIAAVVAQPWADIVLSGAATSVQLQSNLKALSIQLTPQDQMKLLSLKESPESYWNYRSNLPWN